MVIFKVAAALPSREDCNSEFFNHAASVLQDSEPTRWLETLLTFVKVGIGVFVSDAKFTGNRVIPPALKDDRCGNEAGPTSEASFIGGMHSGRLLNATA